MREFRKYEVWEDYWCFEPIVKPSLESFLALNYYCWKPRKNDAINIRIERNENDIDSPSTKQIETFEFVAKNQGRILEGIWNYYDNLILPCYRAAIDIEENEIPRELSELSKIFGIKAIEIAPIEGCESVYFLIEFDFKYDCEHGLYLLFKDSTPIDLFGEGDKDYDSIDLYEKGLYNTDNSPLEVNICDLHGQTVLKGDYDFDETIKFNLSKGAYRIYYTINNTSRIRNFIIDKDMENFTLKYALTNCEK